MPTRQAREYVQTKPFAVQLDGERIEVVAGSCRAKAAHAASLIFPEATVTAVLEPAKVVGRCVKCRVWLFEDDRPERLLNGRLRCETC